MLFSVGYQLRADDALLDAILAAGERVSEVYFAFDDLPNGRSAAYHSETLSLHEAREKQLRDLEKLHENGVPLCLLLNGNCYGADALSRGFYLRLGDTIDFLAGRFGLCGVTTTSPIIARFVRQNFPDLWLRASVNLEIGTVEGLSYLADLFDSFYIRRECNRDLTKLAELKDWCRAQGKGMYGLANSGCLNFCSAHTFHDNLVAHEEEIARRDNAYTFSGQCRDYLSDASRRRDWLRLTNFIRPEDVALYEPYYDGLKLATRVNSDPVRILRAYLAGHYGGSLPALLEPDHSALFYPQVLENSRIPADFTKKAATCNRRCADCHACADAFDQAAITLQE